MDAAAIARALAGVREQLEAIRAHEDPADVGLERDEGGLDGPRHDAAGILARVAEAEAELRLAGATTAA